jgi:hypothetical protein
MKNYFKLTSGIAILVFALSFMSASKMNAQCKALDEKQVTNIDQVKDFVTFTHKQPVKSDNKVVGFSYSQSVAKGHRRQDHCCNFNNGFCGRYSAIELVVDLDGNIVKSNFNMFTGTTAEGTYVRFVGATLDGEDDE